MNEKHGHTKNRGSTKEWRAWRAMIQRCTYPSIGLKHYKRYGGRGIEVCEKWRNSFPEFLSDVGFAPTTKHTLDRINNDGNYTPENCRWATRSEQIRNSTKARYITFNSKTMTIGDWSEKLNINRQTLQMRMDVYGWTIERALSTPVKK